MDTAILALRVVVGLAAVFGALFFLHRWVTRGRPGSPAKAKQIAVVARQGLGAKAGIAVVDAGGRRYLLGVTEHAVTVLDTLGEVPVAGPTLVATQPVTVARFEQELRTVTIATSDVPVLVHGAREVRDPRGPVTATGPTSAGPGALRSGVTAVPMGMAIARPADPHASRRAAREAEARRMQAEAGPLAGSVLSPATWRQTFDALKRGR